MTTIILFEDASERVDWLVAHLPPDTGVVHCMTVEDFEQALGAWAEPDLIILDHDVGEDVGDGADAAELIPNDIGCPVLIWSCNPRGADDIERVLKRTSINYLRMPFTTSGMDMAITLSVLLGTDTAGEDGHA